MDCNLSNCKLLRFNLQLITEYEESTTINRRIRRIINISSDMHIITDMIMSVLYTVHSSRHALIEIYICIPRIIAPVSYVLIREGFGEEKKLFSWNFPWRGAPPPTPLPWKIINFFPTIFLKSVLWSNRPETHCV